MTEHKLSEFGPEIWRCEVCGQSWKRAPGATCPGVPVYSWRQAPDHLLTKKQMAAAGYQTGKKLPAPVGAIRGKRSLYPVYDPAQGIAKRPLTERQAAAYELLRGQSKKIDIECARCGRWIASGSRRKVKHLEGEICFVCVARDEASQWAAERIKRGDFVILDTETTALDGEIIEIAIIGPDGATLLDTLVKPDHPERMIERDDRGVCASDIHGIQPADVESAPGWADVWPEVKRLTDDRTVLIYNVVFDVGRIEAMNTAAGLPLPVVTNWVCLMMWYADYCGEWSEYHRSFRWQRLESGHRAAGDCRAALAVLREMARGINDERGT